MSDENMYDLVDIVDDNGVEHTMVIVDTHTIDGTKYSLLIEEGEFTGGSSELTTIHVVKYVLDEDQVECITGIAQEEFDTVIDELEDHLRNSPE